MNTKLKLIHVFFIFVFLNTNGFAQRPELPSSDNAEEFGREVERFVMAISESGEGFTNPYNRTREELIKNNSRDWETALTRMIAPEAQPWGGILPVWVAVLIGMLVILAGGVGWILLRSKADGRE